MSLGTLVVLLNFVFQFLQLGYGLHQGSTKFLRAKSSFWSDMSNLFACLDSDSEDEVPRKLFPKKVAATSESLDKPSDVIQNSHAQKLGPQAQSDRRPTIPVPTLAAVEREQEREMESEGFLDIISASVTANTEIVLVLVGVPGCGKSTFARQIVESSPEGTWCIACQDVEGDRRKVERLVTDVLDGKSERGCIGAGRVIVDRCNFDAEQRRHWIDIASRRQSSQSDVHMIKLCVVLPKSADAKFCTARALARGDDGVRKGDEDWPFIVSRMVSQYRPPSRRKEGFDAVYWCKNEEELDFIAAVLSSLPSILS